MGGGGAVKMQEQTLLSREAGKAVVAGKSRLAIAVDTGVVVNPKGNEPHTPGKSSEHTF